jgi:hypothetical protein
MTGDLIIYTLLDARSVNHLIGINLGMLIRRSENERRTTIYRPPTSEKGYPRTPYYPTLEAVYIPVKET